jgi:hypothetical protein
MATGASCKIMITKTTSEQSRAETKSFFSGDQRQ